MKHEDIAKIRCKIKSINCVITRLIDARRAAEEAAEIISVPCTLPDGESTEEIKAELKKGELVDLVEVLEREIRTADSISKDLDKDLNRILGFWRV